MKEYKKGWRLYKGKCYAYKRAIQLWLDSGDEFMEKLGERQVHKEIPTVEEATATLKFLLVFSIGCGRLGLENLRTTFESRANMYVGGLQNMGYDRGSQRSKGRIFNNALNQIINNASGINLNF
jgi:hypothetical protein